MNILISCLLYRMQTGSELYVYDVAHELKRRGHTIRIHSAHIGEIFDRTDPEIIVSPRQTAPTQDVVLAQHWTFSESLIKNVDAPVVYVVHSRLYGVESPIRDKRIKHYVSISDDIRDYLKSEYSLDSEVIPNGVDLKRFKPSDKDKEYGFVPGTADGTRIPFMKKLIKETDEPLLFCGYATEALPKSKHVTILPPTWEIEKHYEKAKWVAGLFNGRVQYEAWACGLEFRAYDEHGNKKEVTPQDPRTFSLEKRVDELEELLYDAAGLS